jgi:hypothetical protein
MKKISTAAARQTKNVRNQKLTISLDLGDRSSWYCLLDEVGEVLLEQKPATTPKAMKEVFGAMPHCRIALETGMHSPWVSPVLFVAEPVYQEIRPHHGRSSGKDDVLTIDVQGLSPLTLPEPCISVWATLVRTPDRSDRSATLQGQRPVRVGPSPFESLGTSELVIPQVRLSKTD